MPKLNDPIEPLADHAKPLSKKADYDPREDHTVKAVAGTDQATRDTPSQDEVDAAVFEHNTEVAKELVKKAKAVDDSRETRAAFNVDPKVAKELAEHAPPGVTISTPK